MATLLGAHGFTEPGESFSYAFRPNGTNPASVDQREISLRHSLDAAGSRSFIEMDPDFFSMRRAESVPFDFNLPSCKSPPLVHADQIFSNGRLVPFPQLLSPSMKKEACFSPDSVSDSALTRSVSLDSLNRLLTKSRSQDLYSCHCIPHNPSRNSPGKLLRKYLNFLFPLYKKLKKLRAISSRMARSCGDSSVSSARTSNEFSGIERVRSSRVFDAEAESSIRDAVLHCKKSIANSIAEA